MISKSEDYPSQRSILPTVPPACNSLAFGAAAVSTAVFGTGADGWTALPVKGLDRVDSRMRWLLTDVFFIVSLYHKVLAFS